MAPSKRSKKKSLSGNGWTLIRSCPVCGKPETECHCSSAPAKNIQQTVRLRLEKRRGKSVTVFSAEGFAPEDLRDLVKDLKNSFATGGSSKDNEGVLQGDHREKVRIIMRQRGIVVKG